MGRMCNLTIVTRNVHHDAGATVLNPFTSRLNDPEPGSRGVFVLPDHPAMAYTFDSLTWLSSPVRYPTAAPLFSL